MVFLENVKGLKSHDKGKTLQIVLDSLRKLGYYPHWTILSSLDYGLPQKRERWYCVAFRSDINFEWPKPIGGHPVLRDIVDINDHNPSFCTCAADITPACAVVAALRIMLSACRCSTPLAVLP